jgi:hypothetical protein
MRRAGPFAALLLAAGCASGSVTAGALETIVIDVAPVTIFCIGGCSSYRLTVRSDGSVEAGPPVSAEYGDRREIERWWVSPAQFRAFRAALAPIRPTGILRDDEPYRGELAYGRDYFVEIEWRGPDRNSRLSSQPDGETGRAIHRAVCAVGFFQALGRRLTRRYRQYCR